ncbi:MAG: hypothetical protein NZM04_02520 [Methylacidiphilales bacterium]|nr:hypothetical protein [Candidatus Methylacidiphilales bacterium]
MTLLRATPGYVQSGQTLVRSNVTVPANGTTMITLTVCAGSGPLPDVYVLNNNVVIGAHECEIVRSAPGVSVVPRCALVPILLKDL